ncbi:MAG: hypothetical protein ACTHKV_04995 [Flavipsychrobacter sp.]
MIQGEHEASLKTLQDIRSIMDRSARFISLSGWSGIWAGITGLAGSYMAYLWLQQAPEMDIINRDQLITRFVLLALVVLFVALAGGIYFTWRKTRKDGGQLWNNASKRMVAQMMIPLMAGGIFAFSFLRDGHEVYIAPICLAFYGLALINGSKYTLSDIRYLGLCEVTLGCISLFLPGYGLMLWAIGFGILHILYGIIMWNKYDKNNRQPTT